MRALRVILVLLGATPGVGGLALAQAVPRTDTPRPGAVRVTFAPRIETWDAEFVQGRRLPLGATFTGDSARVWFPSVARLERDVRAVTGLAGYAATLGRYLLAIRAQRRITPIAVEYGITSRLSLGATVPLVRVEVREQFLLRPPGSNLGPLSRLAADSARYRGFFGNLDAALASLGDSIAAGAYGCPTAPSCQRAGALQAEGRALRDALFRAVYGTADTVALYLPLLESDAGRKIAAIVTGLERALADTFRIAQFSRDTFLLPATPVPGAAADSVVAARLSALGLAPYGRATPARLRYFLGDVEVAARYRFFVRRNLATAATLVIRLPTGHQDSPNDPFDVATGDHQTDVEGHVTQELVLGNRLWLNLSIRGGRQLAGERERRVGGGPAGQLFLPQAALARLRWNPGDYLAADFAPLYRFNPHFAAGLTAGYWSRARDRYTFATAQDSIDLAGRLGSSTSAGILDAGTSERRLRIGGAVTYVGPVWEGGLSVEQTVSGAGGPIPAGAVFRFVLRTSKRLL